MDEILFEKDLIRAVASELSMEDKKVEHHLTFLKKFLDQTTNSDDIHSLQLPHLGTMYRNVKGCSHMNIHLKSRGLEDKYSEKFAKNERAIKDILKKLEAFENISLHNTKRRIHNPYFTGTKNKKELEEFQNNGRQDKKG